MKHPGVSAADAGRRPDCKCHGKPMRWNRRGDLLAGGYWRCGDGDRERARAWREKNRDRWNAYMSEWRGKNREHQIRYLRKWRYGIEPEEYDRLFALNAGRCHLCDIPAHEAPKKALHVDHDHVSNRIRGLLCAQCNAALERVERLGWTQRALRYLG